MSSYRETLVEINAKYRHDVLEGKVQPFLMPRDLVGLFLLFVWLMLTPHHTRLPSMSKPATFAAIVASSIWTLVKRRSLGLALGFGVGAQSVMTVILAVNFMLLHDSCEFSRLRLKRRVGAKSLPQLHLEEMPGVNFRSVEHGPWKRHISEDYDVVWQKAPDDGIARACWALDLLFSLRGSHWLWTDTDTSQHQHTTRISAEPPRKVRSIIFIASVLIISYISLDCLKMTMIHDTYFRGEIKAAPPHYLPSLVKAQMPLHLYRTLITVLAIISAIIYLSTLCHIVAVIFLRFLGYGLSGCGWAYILPNGSFQEIARRGLKGFWGEWWHQYLRRHFCSVGDAVADFYDFQLPNGYEKAIRYTVAFLLSGVLHSCGSYTSARSSRPWAAFVPFALQLIGILIEGTAARYLKLVTPKMAEFGPWRTRGHLGFTLSWLMLTFHLLINDLARSGIWLIEPVPFSLLRWMGMSEEKDSWNCWRGSWFSFYNGTSCWENGFAVNGPR